MSDLARVVGDRLSLRPPQRAALGILARYCDLVALDRDADPSAALAAVRAEWPEVEDFERDFPSLCFALATGVGKTRLMGAFIAYLHEAKGVRNFFVLAPNLTIYRKLVTDFTPNTPKYVLRGLGAFAADPPEIVTGENYEDGRVVREGWLYPAKVHVNIFNIGKITSTETPKGAAKSTVPRFRRLREYLGRSYFELLAGLDDLVLIMDESHRYRADAGMRAIAELRPVLGLELTATPHTERGGKPVPFRNVVYSYPLRDAIADGYVKEPAVATRENFDATDYPADALERLKLEDGLQLHEEAKAELAAYAAESGERLVKPFVLVVASKVEHAERLVALLESDEFRGGRYRGKVVRVDSKQGGAERDENVERLLKVEDADDPTEVVVHVDMLKEGWDVTNLYTIVPLRAAESRTLVEQSIGRGLRLPYGRRTGVPALDRLTIVAHDKFQEIVEYAKSEDSVIGGHLQQVGVPPARMVPREVPSVLDLRLGEAWAQYGPPGAPPPVAPRFATPGERRVALAAAEAFREWEHLPRSADLARPDVQAAVVRRVAERLAASGEAAPAGVDVAEVVAQAAEEVAARVIDVPQVAEAPVGEVVRRFRDFDLDPAALGSPQPVSEAILVQELSRRRQHRVEAGAAAPAAERPEDEIVQGLAEMDDVPYDEHADLIQKLAGQVVAHLRSYLPDEAAVRNVVRYHQPSLVADVRAQLEAHYEESAAGTAVQVRRGFSVPRRGNFTAAEGEPVRDFRAPVPDKQNIRRLEFGGFAKCLQPALKFDSDPERAFACVLEADAAVLKWFRPRAAELGIHHSGGVSYKPDFVAETGAGKFVCEVKADDEVDADDVKAEAAAAVAWCRRATEHEEKHGGKPWTYMLVPESAVQENMTLAGLAAKYARL